MHSLPELISRVTRLRVEEGREGERERERERERKKLECTIVHGRRDANLQPRSFFFFFNSRSFGPILRRFHGMTKKEGERTRAGARVRREHASRERVLR